MKKFIAFEGCEGVGKSTQLKLLANYLKHTGQEAVFTREPGGTPLAEKVRTLILTEKMSAQAEALLFAAARAEHVDKVILPALREGKTVICDRFIDSSLAYQGYARGLGCEAVLKYNAYTVQNCMPDATLFIDLDPSNSFRKQAGEVIDGDRMETETEGFHRAVYLGFKDLAKKYPRFISVVPKIGANETSEIIIAALKNRGVID